MTGKMRCALTAALGLGVLTAYARSTAFAGADATPAPAYADFAAPGAAAPAGMNAYAVDGGKAVTLHLAAQGGRRVLAADATAGRAIAFVKTAAAQASLEETYTFVYRDAHSVVEPFFVNARSKSAQTLEGFTTDLSASRPGFAFAGNVTYRYVDGAGREQHVTKGRLRTEPYFYRTGHTYRVDAIADMTTGLLTTRVYDAALGPQTFDTRIASPSRGTLLYPGVLLPAGGAAIGDFGFGPAGHLPLRAHIARRAADYLDYLGYNASADGPVSSPEARALVRYFPALSIAHVRVPADPRFLPALNALAHAGIDADVLTGNHTTIAGLHAFVDALANAPDSLELWNEPNNPSEGASYDPHFLSDLPPFAQAVRKAYPHVRLWGPSALPDPNGYPSAIVKLAPAIGPLIDAWNAHPYTLGAPENLGYGGFFGDACGPSHQEDCGWYGAYNYNDDLAAIMNPNLPGVTTEGAASYGSDPGLCGHTNVDPATQQAYVERGMLYDFKLGHLRIYPYKFIDDGSCSDGFGTYGIIARRNGPDGPAFTPKPAYTALAGLDRLLADAAPNARGFTPEPLTLAFDGAAANVETMILAQSDGSYRIVLWNDAPLWDFNANGEHAAGRALVVAPERVTLRFARPMAAAIYTQVPGTGSWSVESHRGQAIDVAVDGFPLVVAVAAQPRLAPAALLPRDVPR